LSSTAEKIKARQLVTHVIDFGGEELEFRLLRPQAMHLIAAGMPIACFSHRRTVSERLKTQQEYFLELSNDEKKLNGYIRKMLVQCMVDPKFHDGPLETCPDGQVCMDQIEGVAGDIFEELMALAGYREAEVAAKVAENFREDAGREAGDDGGPLPPSEAVGAAVGQPG
jgi:hypothetical protein